MSEHSGRPQRKAPKPSRFTQPGDTSNSSDKRAAAGLVRTVMPGFSAGNIGVGVAATTNTATASISRTTASTSMTQQPQGKEAAAKGKGRCFGDSAESEGRRDSSSSDSCEVVQGDLAASVYSSSDESDPDLRSSALKHLPPAPVDTSWLEVGDTTTTPSEKSSGRDTPPGGAGTPVAVLTASAGSSPTVSSARETPAELLARKKSFLRCVGKPYTRWPVGVLRFACARRGIGRMTREKDAQVLAGALRAEDDRNKRSSTIPYMDDLLGGIDEGLQDEGCPPDPPVPRVQSEPIPEGVVLTLRAAMKSRSFSVEPNSTLGYAGKHYKTSDVLAIVRKEDAEEDLQSTNSDTRRPEEDGASTSTNTRRSKHCFMRILGLVISDKHRGPFFQSRLLCSRRELDNKETGKKRRVWVGIAEDYRNQELEVARISDDSFVSDLDPNKVMMPNASPQKLCDFFNEVKAAWNPKHANYKKSGSHDNWRSFSGENRNVWLFGEAVIQYPTLIEVCNNLLPEGVAREHCGTSESNTSAGSMGTAESDRERRAEVNKRAKEASVSVGTSRKKVKAEASGSAAANDKFDGMLASVVEAFRPEPKAVESNMVVTEAHFNSHANFVENIEKEEAKGDRADKTRVVLLKRQRDRLARKIEDLMCVDL